MAVRDRVEQFRNLLRQALHDLFDQSQPIGRLALVQVLMLSGDTLVTISLAGSLFFSLSPDAAKSKVLLYLLLTLAPFAIVSPLLGPLIDRSRGARRLMVVFSAVGRATLCPLMATHLHSLLLFPLAFLILVLSKLYLVTRGALVPELAAMNAPPATAPGRAEREVDATATEFGYGEVVGWTPQSPVHEWDEDDPAGGPGVGGPAVGGPALGTPGVGGPPPPAPVRPGYAALNARLTLLGTLAGFVASIPGIIILKTAGAAGVLVFDAFVFAGAALAGFRLPIPRMSRRRAGPPSDGRPVAASRETRTAPVDRDLAVLQPKAHPEVLLGLSANSLLRGLAGFLIFLLAFGLRRLHAPLWWYGLALGGSGAGALVGLLLVPRLRRRLIEQQILLGALVLSALAAALAAWWGTLLAQAFLAFMVGVAGSLGQPSFDALAQRLVPLEAQGRAFARFATRQQLVWVLGALIPVAVTIPLPTGDAMMAVAAAVGAVIYASGRRALRTRALPKGHETTD